MIAIIADVHGNYPALQAVLLRIAELGCADIVNIGDVAGYYPFINECIDLLRERKRVNLIGNHDFYLITGTACPRSAAANICLEYQRSIVQKSNLQWLSKSRIILTADSMCMIHGNLKDPLDGYTYRLYPRMFSHAPYKILFCAHTHVQTLFKHQNFVFCNPGSVGQPRDGDPRAAFATYDVEKNNIKLHRIEYKISVVEEKMRSLDFDPKYFTNLSFGSRIGGKIDEVRYYAQSK